MVNDRSILLQAAHLSNPWSDTGRTAPGSIDAERVPLYMNACNVLLMTSAFEASPVTRELCWIRSRDVLSFLPSRMESRRLSSTVCVTIRE